MSSYLQSSQLADSRQTAASTTIPRDDQAYGLISFLGLAQRLNVNLLPNRWMAGLRLLGNRGHGGQAHILETSDLAFKRFERKKSSYVGKNDHFQEPVNEMLTLKHGAVHGHQHLTQLKGLCWDFSDENEVYPVFVFEMSKLGDLYYFASFGQGQALPFHSKLQLCVDVGLAIRDLHAGNIVHGDIKPRNVIVFGDDPRYIAKVNDFGFATIFQGEWDSKRMPRSPIWCAPEWHDRNFSAAAAKKMDIFSWGMLCLWLLSETDFLEDLPCPPGWAKSPEQFISFDECRPLQQNGLELWKLDGLDYFIPLAALLINRQTHLKEEAKKDLILFFESTLSIEPTNRSADFDILMHLLDPTRSLPKRMDCTLRKPQEQEEFSILNSAPEFYMADFRLRPAIAQELQSIISVPTGPVFRRVSRQLAAMQLAICYKLGFGVNKDDEMACSVLNQWSLAPTALVDAMEYFKHSVSYYSRLDRVSIFNSPRQPVQNFDHRSYYQYQGVLEKAESQYAREIHAIEETVGPEHEICLVLKSFLANILSSDRHQETSELMGQVVEQRRAILGSEHPETWQAMETLAIAYQQQDRLDEEEEILLEMIESMMHGVDDITGVGGSREPYRRGLRHMHYLAGSRRSRNRLSEAEELYTRVIEDSKTLLGDQDQETLTRMAGLSSLYIDQERWDKVERLLEEFVGLKRCSLGSDHPDMSTTIAEWMYTAISGSDRWDHESSPPIQCVELVRRVLGADLTHDVFSILARPDDTEEPREIGVYQEIFNPGEERLRKFLLERHGIEY